MNYIAVVLDFRQFASSRSTCIRIYYRTYGNQGFSLSSSLGANTLCEMEMLSSAAKMDSYLSFVKADDFEFQDFGYMDSGDTALEQMIHTEKALSLSCPFGSKSDSENSLDDFCYFEPTTIIKREPDSDYSDCDTTSALVIPLYDDKIKDGGYMSVEMECLMDQQQFQDEEAKNVVIKVETCGTDASTKRAADAAQLLVTVNGKEVPMQNLIEDCFRTAQSAFIIDEVHEDVQEMDLLFPSLFTDCSAEQTERNNNSVVPVKSEVTIKSETFIKSEFSSFGESIDCKRENNSFGNEVLNNFDINGLVHTEAKIRSEEPVSERISFTSGNRKRKKLEVIDDLESKRLKDDDKKKAADENKLKDVVEKVKQNLANQKETKLKEKEMKKKEREVKLWEKARLLSQKIAKEPIAAAEGDMTDPLRPGTSRNPKDKKAGVLLSPPNGVSSGKSPTVASVSKISFKKSPGQKSIVVSPVSNSLEISSAQSQVALAAVASTSSSVSSAYVFSASSVSSKWSPNTKTEVVSTLASTTCPEVVLATPPAKAAGVNLGICSSNNVDIARSALQSSTSTGVVSILKSPIGKVGGVVANMRMKPIQRFPVAMVKYSNKVPHASTRTSLLKVSHMPADGTTKRPAFVANISTSFTRQPCGTSLLKKLPAQHTFKKVNPVKPADRKLLAVPSPSTEPGSPPVPQTFQTSSSSVIKASAAKDSTVHQMADTSFLNSVQPVDSEQNEMTEEINPVSEPKQREGNMTVDVKPEPNTDSLEEKTAMLTTDSVANPNKEKKKKINLSEYKNRLMERRKIEIVEQIKTVTVENQSDYLNIMSDHNYCKASSSEQSGNENDGISDKSGLMSRSNSNSSGSNVNTSDGSYSVTEEKNISFSIVRPVTVPCNSVLSASKAAALPAANGLEGNVLSNGQIISCPSTDLFNSLPSCVVSSDPRALSLPETQSSQNLPNSSFHAMKINTSSNDPLACEQVIPTLYDTASIPYTNLVNRGSFCSRAGTAFSSRANSFVSTLDSTLGKSVASSKFLQMQNDALTQNSSLIVASGSNAPQKDPCPFVFHQERILESTTTKVELPGTGTALTDVTSPSPGSPVSQTQSYLSSDPGSRKDVQSQGSVVSGSSNSSQRCSHSLSSRWQSRSRSQSRRRSSGRSRSSRRRSRSCSVRRHRRRSSSSESSSSRSRSPIRRSRFRRYDRSRSRSSSSEYRNSRSRRERCLIEDHRQANDERRIIFIGGIPSNFTKHDLIRKFEHFGKIKAGSVHHPQEGDCYGFLTFLRTDDAERLKAEGPNVSGCEGFQFCYGGRRGFCKMDYADLDDEYENWYQTKQNCTDDMDFEALLKETLNLQKKKQEKRH